MNAAGGTFMKAVRGLLLAIGILAILLGCWWMLQGTGIVPIGFMAHQEIWAWRGAGLAIVGVVGIVISRRM